MNFNNSTNFVLVSCHVARTKNFKKRNSWDLIPEALTLFTAKYHELIFTENPYLSSKDSTNCGFS